MTHTITTQRTGHITIPARSLRSGDVVDLFGATTATVAWVEELAQGMVCVALATHGENTIAVTIPGNAECIATRSRECNVCTGTGETRLGWLDHPDDHIVIDCPNCDGTGVA